MTHSQVTWLKCNLLDVFLGELILKEVTLNTVVFHPQASKCCVTSPLGSHFSYLVQTTIHMLVTSLPSDASFRKSHGLMNIQPIRGLGSYCWF